MAAIQTAPTAVTITGFIGTSKYKPQFKQYGQRNYFIPLLLLVLYRNITVDA
jgi:hypothetical protein